MTTKMRHYSQPVTSRDFLDYLNDPGYGETVDTGHSVDFGAFNAKLKDLRQKNVPLPEWDRHLAEPLHRALRSLPRRLLLDMRLWHWVCISAFPEFVWERWTREEFNPPYDDAKQSVIGRFTGTMSLNGVSRNGLARLFWCADVLYDSQKKYSSAKTLLENQDFYQAVLERKFGLFPPAARACVATLGSASEAARREVTKKLNHYFTTISVETLSQKDIEALIAA